MNEEKARRILGSTVKGDYLEGYLPDEPSPWVTSKKDYYYLAGKFIPDQLKALVWWMENKHG